MGATNTITNLAAQVAEATDIRDIRPLVGIPNPWVWLWVALGVVAVAAGTFWLWKWIQKRNAQVSAIPPVPAHVLARQRLQEALALIGQPKLFVIAVSDALRAYLEAELQLRAPERTTEEFLLDLQHSHRLSEGQKSSLGDFLQSCDLVKFARYEPREGELRELHSYALELVAQTEPPPTAAPDSPAGTENPEAAPVLASSSVTVDVTQDNTETSSFANRKL